jgi:hypothetical protein
VLLLAILMSARAGLWAIGCMFFLASIAPIIDNWEKRVYQTWLLPLQWYRAPLFGLTGGLMLLGFVPRLRSLSLSAVPAQAWILLLMGLYGGVLRMYHVSPEDGLSSAVLAVATLGPLALVLPTQLQHPGDAVRFPKVLVWTTMAWTALAGVQFVLNRDLVVLGVGRHFTGLIANGNQAGTMLNVVAVCGLWLVLNGGVRTRWLYIWCTAGFLGMLYWTASRGGMLTFVVGAAVVTYSRLGRLALMMPVVAVLVYLVMQVGGMLGVSVDVEHLFSLENTRQGLSTRLIANFFESPVIGVGPIRAEGSENSYLLAPAAYGFGMLLLLLAMMAAGFGMCRRLFFLRFRVGREFRGLIDLCMAQQVMYYFNALFEGIMVGRVGSNTVTIMMFAAMGKFLLEYAGGTEGTESWDAEGELEPVEYEGEYEHA